MKKAIQKTTVAPSKGGKSKMKTPGRAIEPLVAVVVKPKPKPKPKKKGVC